MSNETLSYLGYEDLSDFSSQHSDFANLLVNKEGYIYKFQNFSWIDFILYSGSPNKSALLQLKSGEPLEIKLSVKEVHLLNELGGSSMFYAIRILSDNFVNIASKTDASITKQSPPQNAFNLNSLIEETTPANPVQTAAPEATVPESKETSDFVLNFPSTESVTASKEPIKLDLSEEKEEDFILSTNEETPVKPENDFKLNFSDTFLKTEEPEEETSHENSIEKNDFSLNFLKEPSETLMEKDTEEKEKEEVTLDFIKPVDTHDTPAQEEDITSGFKLKHVQMDETHDEVEEKEEKITLNFLNTESFADEPTKASTDDIKITPSQEEVQSPKIGANLDFLHNTIQKEDKPTDSLDNKEQIIAQIQNDIKEIDEVEEDTLSFQKPQETLTREEDVTAYLFNKNEVKKEKKSFTKTLKSLFAEADTLSQTKENDEEYLDIFKEPEATLKQEEPNFLEQKTPQEYRFPTLATLGLEKEEEDDLISEFISDTKSHIRLFNDFYHSRNLDQAEYTLIKMQSSANILNLNDIIITLANIKQSCTNNDSASIEQLLATLEKQVSTLESYLESETV